MPFGNIFRIGHPVASALFGGGDDGPNYGTSRNPNPFVNGIDPRTAYETRKRAKRIYSPAMAALVAQGQLLQPTLDLTRRAKMGAIDILGDIGPDYMAAYRGADPETSGLLHLLNVDASSLVNRGSMDPFEDRLLQENIRGAQAARGLGYSPAGAFEELINLDRARDERRMARGRYGAEITEAGRRYYSPLMQELLGGSGAGTSTDDLLSLSVNDTMQRRNQHAGRVAGNQALIGGIIESVLGAAGGAALGCWVAEVLYGVDDPRTHLARAYVANHPDKPFHVLYQAHGKEWARWLEQHPEKKAAVQPIWDSMWQNQLASTAHALDRIATGQTKWHEIHSNLEDLLKIVNRKS